MLIYSIGGCGKSKYSDGGTHPGPFVIGGRSAKENELPWQVQSEQSPAADAS